MADHFSWSVGKAFPPIAAHSDRKLRVIEQYLDVYFETVARNPRMDNLNISIIDGFCGGGVYQANGKPRSGSPLVLLEGVFRAAVTLNMGRRKPLKIDASFYFSDENREHIEHLRHVLAQSQFAEQLGRSVHLEVGKFEALLPSILARVRARQTQGRSIFVLDQFGYKDVPMQTIAAIFATLPKAEAILTFSIDALLNYLQTDKDPTPQLQQFGVDLAFLRSWSEWKNDEKLGRAFAQRTLMTALQKYSGAKFFTPFMLFSEHDNRWMMIAHLSQNQAARDKMLGVHWRLQNTFKHIGRGSLFEVGFDARVIEQPSFFNFAEEDHKKMVGELENELPEIIYNMISHHPLPIGAVLDSIGNRTAASNEVLFDQLTQYSANREIEVIGSSGAFKRAGTQVVFGDKIIRPKQPLLFPPMRQTRTER